jgi:hypothetical protein
MRNGAVWIQTTADPNLWMWGDWVIVQITGQGYYMIVSSGIEYGPFANWELVTQHAEDVRGD